MTEQELAELERLAEAATPGPWDDVISTWSVRALGPQAHGEYICDLVSVDAGNEEDPEMGPQTRANKALIAAARSAVPALIAWGRGLERYNGELGQHLKEVVDERDAAIARAETAERARDELHREYGILMRIHSEAELALGARAEQAERERDEARGESRFLARDNASTLAANEDVRARLAEVSQERDTLAGAMKQLAAQAAVMLEALGLVATNCSMLNEDCRWHHGGRACNGECIWSKVKAALAPDAGRARLAEREAERVELAVLREALALLLARRQPRGGAGGQTITSSTCWACRADFANPSTAVSPLCPACERRDAIAEGHAALAKLDALGQAATGGGTSHE